LSGLSSGRGGHSSGTSARSVSRGSVTTRVSLGGGTLGTSGRDEGTGSAGVADDVLAGVGNDQVTVLSNSALFRRHVDDVEVRKTVVEVLAAVGTARDGDRSTGHVDLPVANAVVPHPTEGRLAVGEAGRDLELESLGAIVAVADDRAATFKDHDVLPDRGLGGCSVQGDSQLTGTTTVTGGTVEAEKLVLTHGHVVHMVEGV
jgi:hypothetical protein